MLTNQTFVLSVLIALVLLAMALIGWMMLRGRKKTIVHEGRLVCAGVAVVYSPAYRMRFYGLEYWHKVDLHKYEKIAQHLMAEKIMLERYFYVPDAADFDLISQVHQKPYLDSLQKKITINRIFSLKLPFFVGKNALRKNVLLPMQTMVGGTVEATNLALQHGFAINIGGGFIHAKADYGTAYCLYNDVAVAIKHIRSRGIEDPILIVSTCAHQSDGINSMFRGAESVVTFSMFQADAHPIPKVEGDVDLSISSNVQEDEYLGLLEQYIPSLLEQVKPKLVFHIAGADVLKSDPGSRIELSEQALVRRDMIVTREIRKRGIALVHLLGSGYGPATAQAQARSIRALIQEQFA